MVIQQLTFHVPPSLFERFLREDARVWTAMLDLQDGFLGKEVWRETGHPERVHIVVRWQSRASLRALRSSVLIETELAFTEAMGTICPILSSVEYDCAVAPTSAERGRKPSSGAAR